MWIGYDDWLKSWVQSDDWFRYWEALEREPMRHHERARRPLDGVHTVGDSRHDTIHKKNRVGEVPEQLCAAGINTTTSARQTQCPGNVGQASLTRAHLVI
jgi:hypothetical protein